MKELTQILGIIIMFCFSLTVHAQNNDLKNSTPEERAQFQTEWMKTELALDSVQVEKVHAINLKYANKLEGIKNSSGDRRQKFQKFQKLSAEKDSELKKVVTDQQYKIYLKKKDEIRSKMKSRRKNR